MLSFDFESGVDGWSTVNNGAYTYETSGGSGGGGYMRGTDTGSGAWAFAGPSGLLGDLTSYYGGTISFDLIQLLGTTSVVAGNDLVITGGGLTLVADIADPGTSWTSYALDIDLGTFHIGSGTGRIATRAEILTALADVTSFTIRGEYRGGDDAAGLDNFRIEEGEPAPPLPGPALVVESTFDTDRDGWTFLADVAQFRQVAIGGAGDNGGYLESVDAVTGQWWYFAAGDKYLGDMAHMMGGVLSYDKKQSVAADSSPTLPDIVLRGAGLVLVLNQDAPGIDWTHYEASLSSASAWRVNTTSGALATDEQIRSVLNGLTAIEIRGEYRSGADTGGLDNFRLTAAANTRIGTDGVDTVRGTGLADQLFGFAGNDIIIAGSGDDRLDGGAGNDRMTGGLGNDIYVVEQTGDVVTEAANGGFDTVEAWITHTLAAEVEQLVLKGAAAINGVGNALDNVLIGNGAANVLNGGVGADSMTGGLGDDIYVVDNAGDVVTEASNAGIDTVRTTISYTLGANVENLALLGNGAVNGTGNTLSNSLTGNIAANILDGAGGADSMAGGRGDDIYMVNLAGDVVIEAFNEGVDTVRASVSYTLSANVENIEAFGNGSIQLTGNGLANRVIGGAGNNRLDGGAGADVMIGGKGSDTYVVDQTGDVVTELPGEGDDTVESFITYTLGDNVENLRLQGTAALTGVGNALNNLLYGNSGANILHGGDGKDYLYGGLGNDILVGGNGVDRFYFDTAPGAGNVDRINGFSVADDTIYLENAIFTGLATGRLVAAGFVIGTEAVDADDRVIYDSATGAIYFDVDGVGGVGQVQFATLTAGLAMTNDDVWIY